MIEGKTHARAYQGYAEQHPKKAFGGFFDRLGVNTGTVHKSIRYII